MEFEREIIFISTIAYKSIYAPKSDSNYQDIVLGKYKKGPQKRELFKDASATPAITTELLFSI
ncbi:hypothetical protein D9M71_533940 [compost metagenome]|nr:hypothetical protein UF12_06795 [Acinetobacter calcoaceticus]